MIPRAYVMAFVLPVAFAVAVMAARAGNASDRRGPTVLTEREVTVTPRTADRSVPEIWLQWSQPAGPPGSWLTREMLSGLGFEINVDPSDPRAEDYYRRQLSRRAFAAFELDGPAWRAVVAERRAPPTAGQAGPQPPERIPDEAFAYASRLVPVDVARDAETLERRYPDPRTHLIAAAVIRIGRFEVPGQSPYVGAVLLEIDPQRLQVPSGLGGPLPARGRFESPRARYTVSLMYGPRWEPRVIAVEAVSER